ncbi:MAG: DUF2007 domain-containing protein [Lentisphaeraceae bacterium]|nr:DUF2007 domain-containing protein [Lentisphaeraceae bacterium]
MKLIETSPDVYRIQAIRAVFDKEEISYHLNNEFLAQLSGEIPLPDCYAEIYVDDVDYDRAVAVYEKFRAEPSGETWKCVSCEELIEDQFDICWNCETVRSD